MLSFRRAFARRLVLPTPDIAAPRVPPVLRTGLIPTMLVLFLPLSPPLATLAARDPHQEEITVLCPPSRPSARACSMPAQGQGRPATSRWAVGTSGGFSGEGRRMGARRVEVRCDSYRN